MKGSSEEEIVKTTTPAEHVREKKSVDASEENSDEEKRVSGWVPALNEEMRRRTQSTKSTDTQTTQHSTQVQEKDAASPKLPAESPENNPIVGISSGKLPEPGAPISTSKLLAMEQKAKTTKAQTPKANRRRGLNEEEHFGEDEELKAGHYRGKGSLRRDYLADMSDFDALEEREPRILELDPGPPHNRREDLLKWEEKDEDKQPLRAESRLTNEDLLDNIIVR